MVFGVKIGESLGCDLLKTTAASGIAVRLAGFATNHHVTAFIC